MWFISGAGKPDDGGFAGEDADDVGAPLDVLHGRRDELKSNGRSRVGETAGERDRRAAGHVEHTGEPQEARNQRRIFAQRGRRLVVGEANDCT
jgi:hypothetical protein